MSKGRTRGSRICALVLLCFWCYQVRTEAQGTKAQLATEEVARGQVARQLARGETSRAHAAAVETAKAADGRAENRSGLIPRFELAKSGLELERRTQNGSFFDVVGRRAAVFGYENRSLEAWVYPLKVLDSFSLSFRLQDYPLDIPGPDVATAINVRPEATVLTYSHAAFTVRQIVFAPVAEPGIIMLLDVHSVLPMTITASFKPPARRSIACG